MKKSNYLFLLTLIFSLFNCQSKDDSEVPNSAPEDFTIIVSEIQSTKAKVNWTQANDPDGDNVTYSMALNNNTVVQDVSVRSYDLEGLTDETSYPVKITAKDVKDGRGYNIGIQITSPWPHSSHLFPERPACALGFVNEVHPSYF